MKKIKSSRELQGLLQDELYKSDLSKVKKHCGLALSGKRISRRYMFSFTVEIT